MIWDWKSSSMKRRELRESRVKRLIGERPSNRSERVMFRSLQREASDSSLSFQPLDTPVQMVLSSSIRDLKIEVKISVGRKRGFTFWSIEESKTLRAAISSPSNWPMEVNCCNPRQRYLPLWKALAAMAWCILPRHSQDCEKVRIKRSLSQLEPPKSAILVETTHLWVLRLDRDSFVSIFESLVKFRIGEGTKSFGSSQKERYRIASFRTFKSLKQSND